VRYEKNTAGSSTKDSGLATAANNVFMSAWGSVGVVVSGSLFNFIPAKRRASNGGQFGAGRHKHGPL